MSQDIDFKLIPNFKCKRCNCLNYDKIICTGNQSLDDENSIQKEIYVCRNCNLDISNVIIEHTSNDYIQMESSQLLNEANVINENEE